MTVPAHSGGASHSLQSTGAQMTAIVVYENRRTLPNTSLHVVFDCQLYGVPNRALDNPVVANLRYFNRDHLNFTTETGAMVVKADITRWEPNAPLHLMSSESGDDSEAADASLTEKDFSIIGDIKWVLPLKSIGDAFDFNKIQAPLISASGVVASSKDQLDDRTLGVDGKVAIFEFSPTQYTSYFAHDSVLRTLPIKAFFRLSSKRYEHGAPLPHPGRIVHVDGFLWKIHRDASSALPTCFVIEVEDIATLGQGTIPQSSGISRSSGKGSHKRKFAFDPTLSLQTDIAEPSRDDVQANSEVQTSAMPVPAPVQPAEVTTGDSIAGSSTTSTSSSTRSKTNASKRARKD
ncbi:uncharacterized protein TRAVEDRAFT_21519 [Trametes versicolor FP-101664 SS1]|uniref:uncharacterized protein n=1 Tax=Trametes versicolor (strain FP-101664) TaxID=717944 RepID=UPI0004622F19|nr:uncharacterized protein TRAVEDRAFT_21519 [Trametes versicolor FP-101664 SS1]EIW56299.1 hypothetical protein TRAVEDRAFT_21519 [Trametes versicolor FP-101664 SS1]